MLADVLSNLVITKVDSASTMHSPKGKGARRKDRPRWAIIMKFEGETVYTSNGKRILSDVNHLVILPKGCTYEWLCTEEGHFSTIEFDAELSLSEPIPVTVKNSERIRTLFRELEYKRNLKHPTVALESIRDTYSILLALFQTEVRQYLPSEKQQKIAPALEYVSQHYNKNVTNDSLAALTGLSTVYFRKLFTETVGISPISYVQRLRIEKAKEMLKSDYGTLSDLAQSLGYSSLYDFSRAFKKHTGVSPSKY